MDWQSVLRRIGLIKEPVQETMPPAEILLRQIMRARAFVIEAKTPHAQFNARRNLERLYETAEELTGIRPNIKPCDILRQPNTTVGSTPPSADDPGPPTIPSRYWDTLGKKDNHA